MGTVEALFRISMGGPFVRFCWDYLFVHGSASVRDIREAGKVAEGDEAWWPYKAALDYLGKFEVVEYRDNAWRLTELGRQVRDVQAKIRSVPEV